MGAPFAKANMIEILRAMEQSKLWEDVSTAEMLSIEVY